MKTPSRRFLAILAFSVLVVFVAYTTAGRQGDLIGCQAFLTRLGGDLAQYARDNGGRYPASLQELVPKYIPNVPQCPRSEKPYLYEHTEAGFKVSCLGHHPGLKPGNPYTDSGRVASVEASASPASPTPAFTP